MEPVAGCDPHLDTFDLVAVDGLDRELTAQHHPNTPTGWADAVAVCNRFAITQIGIENASGYGIGLAQAMTAAGVTVIDIPTKVTAEGRRRTGGGKTDRGDARIVARAVLAGKGNQWLHTPHLETLRILTHRRNALVKDQTRDLNRLRALLVEHDPVLAARLPRLRSTRILTQLVELPTNSDPIRETTATIIRDLADDTRRRLGKIRQLKRDLTDHMPPIGWHLITTIDGCGVITAAILLGELAGTDGFTTDAKLAKWSGVAPLDASSGRTQDHHRLNRGGNRQANRAIHTIVTTQLRHGGEAADYINRRRQQGDTKRNAIRACKRHIARRIWKTLHQHHLT